MSVSALDSRVFRNLFGTEEIRNVFSDEAYVALLIDTEAALARAESTVGVIPVQAGQAITAALAKVEIEYVYLSACHIFWEVSSLL
jgi:3-carboxy-cis,cis-muconate cycloisomerase